MRCGLSPVCMLALLGFATASAQVPSHTFQSAAPAVVSDPDEARARQARQEAERDLAELRRFGDTAMMEQARDALGRGDSSLASRGFVAATAAYREVASLARRAKSSGDRVRQMAKAASTRAKSTIQSVVRLNAGTLDAANARWANLSVAKFNEANQLESSGQFAEAARLYDAAEGFARRVTRADPAAHDTCDAARANISRVRDSLQRAEAMILAGRDELAVSLVGNARRFLDEADRQLLGNLCSKSLESSRLAESLIKRAAEIELARRR